MGLFPDQNHISHVSAARLVFAMNRGRNDSTHFGVVRLTFMLAYQFMIFEKLLVHCVFLCVGALQP